MKRLLEVALVTLFVAGPTGVTAQGVINRPQLSAALANELVGDTVAICAPGGQLDEACAREALAKIQDRIK